MKRGTFIGILILGTILVFSGFIFGQDGELVSEPADVSLTVSGAGNPPEIVFISDINGYENIGDVPGADRDLTAGGSAVKKFKVYVWSDAGTSALPSGVLQADDINLTLYNPGSVNIRRSSSCTRQADANAPAGSVAHIGETTAVFECSASIQYYDSFGTALAPNWTVNASAKDIWDQVDSDLNFNSVAQPDRFTFFNILRAFELGPLASPSLDYGTVSYRTGLNREPLSNYPLQIKNIGNSDISTTSLKSYKIPGATTKSEYIPVEWFSMHPDSACGAGTNLQDETYLGTGLPNIIHGDGVYDELKICLNQIQTSHAGGSVSQQSYSTTNILQGQIVAKPWEIDVSYLQ